RRWWDDGLALRAWLGAGLGSRNGHEGPRGHDGRSREDAWRHDDADALCHDGQRRRRDRFLAGISGGPRAHLQGDGRQQRWPPYPGGNPSLHAGSQEISSAAVEPTARRADLTKMTLAV